MLSPNFNQREKRNELKEVERSGSIYEFVQIGDKIKFEQMITIEVCNYNLTFYKIRQNLEDSIPFKFVFEYEKMRYKLIEIQYRILILIRLLITI